jgi:hypothetical protein
MPPSNTAKLLRNTPSSTFVAAPPATGIRHTALGRSNLSLLNIGAVW